MIGIKIRSERIQGKENTFRNSIQYRSIAMNTVEIKENPNVIIGKVLKLSAKK